MDDTGAWRIEARAFPIPYTPFSHNFWALVNPPGEVVDQLHGLAVDRQTGRTKAVGTARDLLQVVRDGSIRWSLKPGQPVTVCASGTADEIGRRWQAAVDAMPAINALALPYPNPWQHFYRLNSNSVFCTLGRIMAFVAPAFLLGTWAPGAELVVSQTIVEDFRYSPPV
jgi:hypothetical protein